MSNSLWFGVMPKLTFRQCLCDKYCTFGFDLEPYKSPCEFKLWVLSVPQIWFDELRKLT